MKPVLDQTIIKKIIGGIQEWCNVSRGYLLYISTSVCTQNAGQKWPKSWAVKVKTSNEASVLPKDYNKN